jgi:exonuclease III
MRILTLNICHGGGSRVPAICTSIARHNADILVLTEFREGRSGRAVRERLAAEGWIHQTTIDPPPKTNGVVIASRIPFGMTTRLSTSGLEQWRAIECQFDRFDLLGVYVPLGSSKPTFWNALNTVARHNRDRNYLILGDFNTGRHLIDEAGTTFLCEKSFRELEELGFIDAWRSLHPEAREYSWFSRAANGFRLDHCFLAPSLVTRFISARYSHTEREQRVSDHSALIVDLLQEADEDGCP